MISKKFTIKLLQLNIMVWLTFPFFEMRFSSE
uniref:Uncharacterized protein n=1 Tax=Rhizophora mucronata TaxID=61149 RepID=A0A2P2NUJ4_RHIMU